MNESGGIAITDYMSSIDNDSILLMSGEAKNSNLKRRESTNSKLEQLVAGQARGSFSNLPSAKQSAPQIPPSIPAQPKQLPQQIHDAKKQMVTPKKVVQNLHHF